MLYKLSLKNIRKSFKDYAIYFFTLILGVSIFYVFNAIESQAVMMDVSANTKNIIKLMTNMLSGVSVFVSVILGFLIIYASRFLMKRRHKEFGIYLTLGMSKSRISFLLFIETMMIGIISLVVGLFLGVFLSQWMSILVINLFEADMRSFQFVFSTTSCVKTLCYFGIIYGIVMIFHIFMVSKCKLIDLLQASKKTEKITMKNPYFCTIIFFLSLFLLGFSYYMVTFGVESMLDSAEKIFIPIFLGILGTYGVVWSFSGLMLKLVGMRKKIYYKGLNAFVFRQISSNINSTVCSISIICIMLFVTICVLSSSLSIKNSMTKNLITLAPMDVQFSKARNLDEEEVKNHYQYTEDMIMDSKISLEETLKHLGFSLEQNLKDMTFFSLYTTQNLTMKDTFGSYYEEARQNYPLMNFDVPELIIKESDYNRLAKMFHFESVHLSDSEYAVSCDFQSFIPFREEGLKRNTSITILDHVYVPKSQNVYDGFYGMSSNHINSGLFIVPDSAVDDCLLKEESLVANYTREGVEEVVTLLEDHPLISTTSLDISSKLSIYESSIGLGALVTFIGLYLGIIFLISSAMILALKELSESSDNQLRFHVLRKIGADEKMIFKALFWQIGLFFLFPLVLAIIHSVFGIMFCHYILSTFGNEALLPSIIMTGIFLIIIYGGYFVITYLCSKHIVKERYY